MPSFGKLTRRSSSAVPPPASDVRGPASSTRRSECVISPSPQYRSLLPCREPQLAYNPGWSDLGAVYDNLGSQSSRLTDNQARIRLRPSKPCDTTDSWCPVDQLEGIRTCLEWLYFDLSRTQALIRHVDMPVHLHSSTMAQWVRRFTLDIKTPLGYPLVPSSIVSDDG